MNKSHPSDTNVAKHVNKKRIKCKKSTGSASRKECFSSNIILDEINPDKCWREIFATIDEAKACNNYVPNFIWFRSSLKQCGQTLIKKSRFVMGRRNFEWVFICLLPSYPPLGDAIQLFLGGNRLHCQYSMYVHIHTHTYV